ncbi:MAG: DNA-processing protein DprA [Rhodocyclaceae bacterium]|nr:DNA-processing protein DprA [Rhodocyclaceae bacterium]
MPSDPNAADPADLLAAWLRLSLTPGLGDAGQRALLAAFGLPDQVLAAGRAALARVVGDRLAATVLDADREAAVAAHLAWASEADHHILTLADATYPGQLLTMADPPTVLFAKGRLDVLEHRALAMVGARSATAQGIDNARAFAAALSGAGLTVVSGLALGIDAAAHEGALDGEGGTIAVIGTGADRIYPSRNQALARRIAREGLILTEFPLGTPARRHHFPKRNRLIAGLARGVLVVEAAIGSGSLITARLAAEQGREVFAIPGSIHSPLSRGCHRLIREGAKLVESAGDVLEELAWTRPGAVAPAVAEPVPADGAAQSVLEALGFDPVDLDTLLQRSGLTPDSLSAILLTMELDGHVARLPGGRFQRIQ